MARLLRKTRPLVWGSAGAAVAYFWDPDRGRARRAQLKDQAAATLRRSQARLERKERYLEGKAAGIAARAKPDPTPVDLADDRLIADKVKSEVLGEPEFRHLDVLVDVADGVATLRGEVPDEDVIRALEQAVRTVEGVGSVQNLLHLPDAPAPNKEASREAS